MKFKLSRNDPLVLVHLSEQEANDLDILQGETLFDDKTGLRSYQLLGPIFKIPEVKKILDALVKQQKDPHSPSAKRVSDLLRQLPPIKNKKYSDEPAEGTPEVEALEAMGKHGDNDLALLPLSVVNIFDKAFDHPRNKLTGLPQYFKIKKIFKKLARWVPAAVGAVLGGPGGGALGGALGGLTAKKDKFKAALLGGALGGLGGYALHGASGLGFGTAASGQGPLGTLVTGTGSLFGGGGPTILSGAAEAGVPGHLSGAGTATQLLEKAKSAPGWLNWENLGKGMALGAIPLQLLGHQKERKALKREKERQEAERQRQQRAMQDWVSDSYLNEPLQFDPSKPSYERKINPNLQWDDPDFYRRGSSRRFFTYARGGSVRDPIRREDDLDDTSFLDGHEEGQEDNIHTNVPDGTYIIDASTVSDLGDGNTKAGVRKIQEFASHFDHPMARAAHGGHLRKKVPVALSAGEMALPPHIVSMIGNGDNRRGARKLDQMVKAIRRHKSSKRTELPPKAKNIFAYLGRK